MGSRGRSPDLARRARIATQLRAGATLQQIANREGCSRQNIRQLLGSSVYQLRPRRGRLPLVDRQAGIVRRFWARVTVAPSGCWLWSGGLSGAGYGRVGGKYAHRTSYIAVKGAIPNGLGLDHLCRVRACVNPDHLEPVTTRENIMRSPIQVAAINARKTHCNSGHPFTPENTGRKASGRVCLTCRRQRTEKAKAA